MEGPGGGFESLLQREAKFPWRGGSFLGGPRGDSESPPLGPSKPPVTPLKRAAQRGPAGPLAATGFPRRRNRPDKGRRIFPLLKRAMRVWAAAQRAPGSARPFEGERLEALWASKSASPTATAKSKILTPRLRGCLRGPKGEDRNSPWPPHKTFPLPKGIIGEDRNFPLSLPDGLFFICPQSFSP